LKLTKWKSVRTSGLVDLKEVEKSAVTHWPETFVYIYSSLIIKK